MSRLAFLTTMAGVPWGGSESLWQGTASTALKARHEVLVVVFDWSATRREIAALENLGATVVVRPRAEGNTVAQRLARRLAPRYLGQRLESWARRVLEFAPSHLCVSQGSFWELLTDRSALRLLDCARCPISHVVQLSNETVPLTPAIREAAKERYRGAANVLFVAEENRRMAERQIAGALPNARVVRNPVNLQILEAVGARSTAAVPVLACVARLNARHKGHDLLLEALSARDWRERKWECRFYGEGADSSYLLDLIAHFGITDRVKLMGHSDDVRGIWEECDLLVMPSRMEGTPLALVEAMICGRPAVVTDVGGMTEWVTEPVHGFVADAPTTRSIGEALERAWAQREQWQGIGEVARRRALELMDPDPTATLLAILSNRERST